MEVTRLYSFRAAQWVEQQPCLLPALRHRLAAHMCVSRVSRAEDSASLHWLESLACVMEGALPGGTEPMLSDRGRSPAG